MMQDPSTRRRHAAPRRERALRIPIRQFGAFLPGTGVGGTGEHWGAVYPRLHARLLSSCTPKPSNATAKQKLPEDHSIQDWGITYDEIEPYYARSEREVGVSGKAGNLNGKKIEGGNIFEGWRSAEYPDAADERAVLPVAVRRRGEIAGLPSIRQCHGDHQRGLHESRRRHAPGLRLLRILRPHAAA